MTRYMGDDGDNDLSGGKGDDVVRGLGGADTLWGGEGGSDTLWGGDGNDVISDGKGDAADLLIGGGGFDTLSMFYGTFFGGGIGAFAYTFVAGAEQLTPGGSTARGFEAVSITGSDYGDTITGGRNGDLVRGWFGNDRLDGGRGNDFVIGDNGADTLYGGQGNDTVTGNGGADVLYGGAGNDFIRGGASFDVEQGDDTICGGAGADELWTGPRTTLLLYDTSPEAVYVNLELGLGFGGDAQGDVIQQYGGTHLVGSAFGDFLIGGITMDGGGGDDRLQNSDETKLISGGAGKDLFVFNFEPKNIWESPTITDFDQTAGERIDLHLIDARAGVGNQAFTFIGTDAFSGRAGEVRYDIVDGRTVIQLNENRGDGVDHTIYLDGEHTLASGDFVL